MSLTKQDDPDRIAGVECLGQLEGDTAETSARIGENGPRIQSHRHDGQERAASGRDLLTHCDVALQPRGVVSDLPFMVSDGARSKYGRSRRG